MTTITQELAPLAKHAWSLTPERVEQVFAALREVPREHLGSGVCAHVERIEKVLGPRVEVGVFETTDRSGPILVAQLPARAAVPEALWRKQVAHLFLLALRNAKFQ